MALDRVPRKGDRVRFPGSSRHFGPLVLVIDRVQPNGIAWGFYADGRLEHGVPAQTCFIAQFHDGTFNTLAEFVPAETWYLTRSSHALHS